MEILLFTFVGVTLYVVSDAIVKAIEKKKGKLLPNRSLIFFGIILVLSTITFNLLQTFGPQLGLLPKKNTQQVSKQPSEQPVKQQQTPQDQETPTEIPR